MEEEELKQVKKTLIHNLHSGGKFMEEEDLKQLKHTINDLTVKIDNKIDKLSKTIGKTIGEKKEFAEAKINENPLAYMAGAFVGGVIVGYVVRRGKD